MPLPGPIAAVANQAGIKVRSFGQSIAIYAVLGLLGLIGCGFLIAAGFIWLAAVTDPLIASLILGVLFLGVASIVGAVMIRRQKRIQKLRRQKAANTALLASSISMADAGLRVVSRMKGPFFWPAAATLLATWYFTKGRNGD